MSTLATVTGRLTKRQAYSRAQRLKTWLDRLVLVVLLLAFMGAAASYSTTVYLRIALGRSPYDDFLQHMLFLFAGTLAASVAVWLVNHSRPAKRWLKYVIPISFYLSLLLVALVKLTPWGVTWMGATRGLNIGFFTFQPSELLKISLVLYLVQLLCWWRQQPKNTPLTSKTPPREDRGEDSHLPRWLRNPEGNSSPSHIAKQGICIIRQGRPSWPELPRRCVVILVLAAGLTAIQPDLGSTGIILGSALITLFLAGVDWRHLLGLLFILVFIGGSVLLLSPERYEYAAKRVDTWLHPLDNDDGAAYQITQARGALAVGGVLGRGFLQSDQKMNRLPLSSKDFVFPILVEELGYIGGVAIIGLFLALAWVSMRLAYYCREPFNRTAIAALGLTISLQGLVNIGTTIGTLPLSGLTLPFFSEGGTSLIVSLAAIGLMYAFSREELNREMKQHYAT